jgi:hypothetical protein
MASSGHVDRASAKRLSFEEHGQALEKLGGAPVNENPRREEWQKIIVFLCRLEKEYGMLSVR